MLGVALKRGGGRDILTSVANDQKPRIFQGGRDMVISMAVIVVIMIAVVLPTGLCTYSPNTPEGGPVTEVDEQTFLNMEAGSANFPLVIPDVPDSWTANSARRSAVGTEAAPVVGYVTEQEGYLQLTQTGLPIDDAVREFDADPRELERTENIAGAEVQVYSSEESAVRDLWVFDHNDTTEILSGAAVDEEFAQLVEATLNGEPAGVAGASGTEDQAA